MAERFTHDLDARLARPSERHLRERAAELRDWVHKTEPRDPSTAYTVGRTLGEMGVTLPAYAAAWTANPVLGMGAMGYLRGRPEGK